MSLSTQAYLRIRDEIVDGRLPPGDILRENSMATRLGMSRTPIRAALESLGNDGLLRPLKGGGYIVEPITLKMVSDLFQLRIVIEAMAVRHAPGRVPVDELKRFRELFSYYAVPRRGLGAEDWGVLEEADRRFHGTILAILDNQFLTALTSQLSWRFAYLRSMAWTSGARTVGSSAEHLGVIEHLLLGSYEAAEATLVEHIRAGESKFLEVMTRSVTIPASDRFRAGRVACTQWLDDSRTVRPSIDSMLRGLRGDVETLAESDQHDR